MCDKARRKLVWWPALFGISSVCLLSVVGCTTPGDQRTGSASPEHTGPIGVDITAVPTGSTTLTILRDKQDCDKFSHFDARLFVQCMQKRGYALAVYGPNHQQTTIDALYAPKAPLASAASTSTAPMSGLPSNQVDLQGTTKPTFSPNDPHWIKPQSMTCWVYVPDPVKGESAKVDGGMCFNGLVQGQVLQLYDVNLNQIEEDFGTIHDGLLQGPIEHNVLLNGFWKRTYVNYLDGRLQAQQAQQAQQQDTLLPDSAHVPTAPSAMSPSPATISEPVLSPQQITDLTLTFFLEAGKALPDCIDDLGGNDENEREENFKKFMTCEIGEGSKGVGKELLHMLCDSQPLRHQVGVGLTTLVSWKKFTVTDDDMNKVRPIFCRLSDQ